MRGGCRVCEVKAGSSMSNGTLPQHKDHRRVFPQVPKFRYNLKVQLKVHHVVETHQVFQMAERPCLVIASDRASSCSCSYLIIIIRRSGINPIPPTVKDQD